MVKPLNPDEAALHKKTVFPSEVFEAFNDLISADLVNGRAHVGQQDVVALIKKKLEANGTVYRWNQDWLNIEDAYEAEGWRVTYDKPGYNESYDASFEFVQKRKL